MATPNIPTSQDYLLTEEQNEYLNNIKYNSNQFKGLSNSSLYKVLRDFSSN